MALFDIAEFSYHRITRYNVILDEYWLKKGPNRKVSVLHDASRARVLFVDDDPALRMTFPQILQSSGFDVATVATVSEALAKIGSHQFEVLISDLNIGEPGDGFTVVSAMRRTQPRCINFILTGYPAFETALQTLRTQVDDFLVKPGDVRQLMEQVRVKLNNPRTPGKTQTQALPRFMREQSAAIVQHTLQAMKSHPRLRLLPLTDAQRIDHLPDMLAEIIQQLESESPQQPSASLLRSGEEHGQQRRGQGYSRIMLVDDVRVLDAATYGIVQDQLLHIDLSDLIPRLAGFNQGLDAHLQASLQAFGPEELD